MSENRGIQVSTFKAPTTEVFVTGHGMSVTCTPWGNHDGVSVMVHGEDLSIRGALSLRWEELDVLMVGLTAARSA